MNASRFRAVFFDAGETLVHPHPSFPELFADIVRREGFEVEPDDVIAQGKVVFERFEEAARDGELWTTSQAKSEAFWRSVYHRFLGLLGLPTSDGLPDVLYREFTDRANYRLFEDVRPALERLHAAGLALGVVSNFEEWLEHLLEELDVTRFFDVRVISGIEGIEKPDPRIFELAMERARVAAAETVYVGDNPIFDIEPAESVGMFAVLLDRRGRHPDASGVRITTMAELPAVLGA